MVLVDTSVWIRFLRNRAPEAAALDRLLETDEVAGHELIYGELLIGDTGGRGEMLKHYGLLHWLPSVPHQEVVTFIGANELCGRGIGWIDAHLLASALVAGIPLWTADDRLAKVAANLGAAYSATAAEW